MANKAKMAELAAELIQKRCSKSADTIDRFSQDIWNHRAFPRESRVVGAFPNDGALLRLGVTISMAKEAIEGYIETLIDLGKNVRKDNDVLEYTVSVEAHA